MTARTFAAAAAGFGRDLDEDFATIATLLDAAAGGGRRPAGPARGRARAATCRRCTTDPTTCRPQLDVDGPEIAPARRAGRGHGRHRRASASAATRRRATARTTAASRSRGDGVLGHHRKVHQPLQREHLVRRGRPLRGVRHAGRADGHDDLLRQGVPRGRARAGGRRRARSSCACRPGRRRAPTRRRCSPTTAGPAASTSSTGPARWRTRSSGSRRTRPGRSGTCGSSASAKIVDPGGEVLADHRDRRGPRRRVGRRRRRRGRRAPLHGPPARPPARVVPRRAGPPPSCPPSRARR